MLRIASVGFARRASACGLWGHGYVYLRADGRDLGDEPTFYQQFETDRMTCQSEIHRHDPTPGGRGRGGCVAGAVTDCMAQKGYVVAPSEAADLKRKALAAEAAEKAQREAAATAPPPLPPVPPKQIASKPKPKPQP